MTESTRKPGPKADGKVTVTARIDPAIKEFVEDYRWEARKNSAREVYADLIEAGARALMEQQPKK